MLSMYVIFLQTIYEYNSELQKSVIRNKREDSALIVSI